MVVVTRGGGGNITCRGYAYVPPIWMVFGVQNSLNKGPLFGRFSLNMGGFSEIGKKLSEMGRFPRKFIVKVGMTATVGN